MTYILCLKQPNTPTIKNRVNSLLAKRLGQIPYEPTVFSRLPFTFVAIMSNIVAVGET
jgi:hypothetical protein